MWIPREVEKTIIEISRERPSLILTGCRQAGKTSLLRHIFPDYHYVSLDIPIEAEQAENAGEEFLRRHPPPVIIDEVQYAPKLLRYIKHRIDSNRDLNGQFLLTGSQKFELMQGVTESLAGRCSIVTCHSLCAKEFELLIKKRLEGERLWDWIWSGGFPELHAKRLNTEHFYSNYLATYLERDLRKIVNVRNLRDFDRFIRLSAVRTGQLISYNSMASDIGINTVTLKHWISVLETSQIIYILEPYYENLGKRIVKTPKLYFLDTGLACFLAGIRHSRDLVSSQMQGPLFETHVVGQIIKKFNNHGRTANIYFYRDHQGHEVDIVLPQGQSLNLIECKSSESTRPESRGFNEVEKLIGTKRVRSRSIITPKRGPIHVGNVTLDDSVDLECIEVS